MSNDKSIHQRPEHAAPYPVSRLAPAFHAPELANEIRHAESMLSARTGAKHSTTFSDAIGLKPIIPGRGPHRSETRQILEWSLIVGRE